ncbi:MAG: REP-associated tyrosine transposase [Bacteroidia bacterium]
MATNTPFPDYDLTFFTMTIVGWQEVFTRRCYQDIVVKNIVHAVDHKGLQVFGYVVMPNHIHMLANSTKEKLGLIVQSFKSFSAREIKFEILENEQLSRRQRFINAFEYHAQKDDRDFQVWTHDNEPKICYSHEFTLQKLNYIEMNPVEAGFVEEPEYWRLSSANPNSPIPVVAL